MQLELFPEWQETTKTAEIWAMALKNAQTPLPVIQAKTGQNRPIVAVGSSRIEQRLRVEVDQWVASRVGG